MFFRAQSYEKRERKKKKADSFFFVKQFFIFSFFSFSFFPYLCKVEMTKADHSHEHNN